MQHINTLQGTIGKTDMFNNSTITATTQCVGFARNWLESHLGMTFSQVKLAADIWQSINHYQRLSDSSSHLVNNRKNGGRHPPQQGDLIIYHKNLLGTGHVAVVTDIKDNKTILVTEQNYLNRYQSPSHRRAIAFSQRGNSYWLQDRFIIGWKQINANGIIQRQHNRGTTNE